MRRGTPVAFGAVAVTLLALGPGAAPAATGNVKFAGETDQGRSAKVVVDAQGLALRGAWTVMTDCDGRFEDFRAQFAMRAPLDRSNRDGFRDAGSVSESDGTYSARYKHVVEGRYRGRHRIKGELSVEVVFRRDGKRYVTCAADGVGFTVKDRRPG